MILVFVTVIIITKILLNKRLYHSCCLVVVFLFFVYFVLLLQSIPFQNRDPSSKMQLSSSYFHPAKSWLFTLRLAQTLSHSCQKDSSLSPGTKQTPFGILQTLVDCLYKS